jgi:hypothetical protein
MKITIDGVTRNMTAEEKEIHEAGQALAEKDAQELADAQTAKQVARQAVLDKLGLTEQEAQLLLGS